uniref:WD_REPEATS_REGION domain-containing protein n=1 Tax=Trichuris muris TaxID=70415 RepID=A0A5S6QNM9_TRIMR
MRVLDYRGRNSKQHETLPRVAWNQFFGMSNYLLMFNEHKDIVQDIAFNLFGTRLATCSCDQTVKVFDKRADGQWTCTHTWKVHCGPVWKIDWAHPCFGQILATCSFDRTVVIWEETVKKVGDDQNAEDKAWVKRASLVDSRCDVVDVKFAPECFGLMLAAGARDGTIRIYEATDLSNLAQWNLQHEIQAACYGLTCLAWCPSEDHQPTLAVGTDGVDPENPKLVLYTYKEDFNQAWDVTNCTVNPNHSINDLKFAPSLGRTFHLLAVASKTLQILRLGDASVEFDEDGKQDNSVDPRLTVVAEFSGGAGQFWRASWNVTGTMLSAIASDGVVHVFECSYDGTWRQATTVLPEGGLT